ncbi:MAG TPA: hypothetical protein VGM09_15135 [Bradyrhizobium sp.]
MHLFRAFLALTLLAAADAPAATAPSRFGPQGEVGALAPAAEDPKAIASIIAFAPGRGGRANDAPNQVGAPHTLIASAAEFAADARAPVLWLVAANDSYFTPDLSRRMADAFRSGGGKVDFRVLPAAGSEGNWLAESDTGEKIFGPVLDSALKPATAKPAAANKR